MSVRSAALATAFVSAALAPTAALAWTKSFVVEYFEPAMFYGGPANGGGATPGTDCPAGVNDMDWSKAIVTPYRSSAEVAAINNAEYGRDRFLAHLSFRGRNRENIYENPTSIDDPGLLQASGQIAEGFDLDDNPLTGFVGPDGGRGVDNAFYRAGGCILYFRGPPRTAPGFKIQNDYMQDGAFAMVVSFSGDQDPMNDDEVTVRIHTSPDKMVKDAMGRVAWDYTFRADPDPKYTTTFKAKVRDGVVTNKTPIVFRSHDLERRGVKRPIILYRAKTRFTFLPDGGAYGLVGGYRDIWDHFRLILGNGRATGGAIRENLGHFNASAWYYALRRSADGLPDPATGANRGVSTTYRYYLTPAIVLPAGRGGVLPASTGPVQASSPPADPEAARLQSAGFAPIAALAAEGRRLRRVTYRDPFGGRNAPNLTIEALPTGKTVFVVTAYDGEVREEGELPASAWVQLTALDRALAATPPRKARAELCHSKQMVIETAGNGQTRRREASVCGGQSDAAAVLYGYKMAELAVTHMPRCKGFIESGREPSWTLAECLRAPQELEDRDNDYERVLGRN